MTDGEPAVDDRPGDSDRLRRIRSIAVSGLVLGVALVVMAGLGGANGRDGLAIMLLVFAVTAAIVGVYGGVTLLIDDLRSVTISGRRIVATLFGFFAAAVLMAMLAGIGG